MGVDFHVDHPSMPGDSLGSAFITCVAAPAGIDRELDKKWLVRALRTSLPRTQMAVDPNRAEHRLVIQVEAFRIGNPVRVLELAPQGEGKASVLCVTAENRSV